MVYGKTLTYKLTNGVTNEQTDNMTKTIHPLTVCQGYNKNGRYLQLPRNDQSKRFNAKL